MHVATKLFQNVKVMQLELEWMEKNREDYTAPFWNAFKSFEETWGLSKKSLSKAFHLDSLDHTVSRASINAEVYDRESAMGYRNTPPEEFGDAIGKIISTVMNWPKAHQNETVLEPVAAMHARGVQQADIARAYGWVNEYGYPQSNMVIEEIVEPGKHTKGYVHPKEKQRRELRADIENWLNEDAELLAQDPDVEALQPAQVNAGVSTLTEAFEAGKTSEEAAALLGIDEMQAEEFYDEMKKVLVEVEGHEQDPDWSANMSDADIKQLAKGYGIAIGNKKRQTLIAQISDAMATEA